MRFWGESMTPTFREARSRIFKGVDPDRVCYAFFNINELGFANAAYALAQCREIRMGLQEAKDALQ